MPSDARDAPRWTRPLGPLVGRGGFATVWEIAAATSGERAGVLKVAHADHDLARARLAREAEALDRIGAPAVPELLGHGTLADGRPWIAMERVVGITFAQLVAAGRVPLVEARRLALATLDALARVHAAGFVHRDLKPDNLVRRPDGSVAILDLGLARKIPHDPDDPTRANVGVGSLAYLPPEQARDAAAVDERSDLYALGCVIYALVAGRPPFTGDAAALERAHAALRPPPLGSLVTVSPAFEALVMELLAKEPAARPASAARVRARFEALESERTPVRSETRSISVISEGHQPVVLVWAELARVDRAVLARLAARKLAIVSQRGRRVLAAVNGAEHGDPAAVAIAAARDLVAQGARVVLHLDLLQLVPGPDGPTPAGEAIREPERWLPPAPWTGVLFTRAFAGVVQSPTRPSEVPGLAEFRAPVDGDAAELVGREGVLADLVADAAGALAPGARARGPTFALVTGDAGVGKTVVARELAQRLRALGVRVEATSVPPPGTALAAHAALANLVNTPVGNLVRSIGDALRAAARARPTAIVIDDLHFADHDLLDALEYATLGGESLPLWIVGFAAPRLDERRPGVGARAERHRRDVLGPLDEEAALQLTARLLEPAQYPPLRALRRLVNLARGNPLHLTMLAREVHERGAIRTRPGGEFFLDTTALDALPPIALGPWLAARELAGASVELVALARLCAVLGGEFDRAQLDGIVALVERAGGASTTIDVGVGIKELCAHGLLIAAARGWRFRQTLLEDGLYLTTAEADRRAIHRAALVYWRAEAARGGDATATLAQIARHAEAIDERDLAAEAYAQLGERARGEHRIFDSDQAWDRALANLTARDRRRARALLGRARARGRLLRIGDALADLDDAIAIADEVRDVELLIEARLEQAIALDWREDVAGASAASAIARVLLAAVPDADRRDALEVEVALAEARDRFRAHDLEDAAARLEVVLARARAHAKPDTVIIAMLLLGPSLVAIGALDRARVIFDELVAACQASGDRFHLGAAYVNRAFLWAALGNVEGTANDLRLVIQLARENGQPTLERSATHNLAEDRLAQGAVDEAIALAERSLALQRHHGEGPTQLDELLLARALAAGARPQLRALVEALLATELADADRSIVQILGLVANHSDDQNEWQSAMQATENLAPETQLEMAFLAQQRGLLTTERMSVIRKLAAAHPFWMNRF